MNASISDWPEEENVYEWRDNWSDWLAEWTNEWMIDHLIGPNASYSSSTTFLAAFSFSDRSPPHRHRNLKLFVRDGVRVSVCVQRTRADYIIDRLRGDARTELND